MAFVNRSNRDIESASSGRNDSTKDIGPGQYLNQGTWENRKQSAAPFNTRSSRRGLLNNNNHIPGPGAYHQVIVSNISNSKQQDSPYYCNGELVNDNIFISSEKRFKSKQSDIKPGPGEYNLTSLPNLHENNNNDSRHYYGAIKPKHLSMTNERVLSIPPKEKSFGYQVSSSGLVSLSTDPDKGYKFSGEKSDSIAPNQYDVKEPFKRNNIIDWKRSEQSQKQKSELSLLPQQVPIIDNDTLVSSIQNKENHYNKRRVRLGANRNIREALKTNEDKSNIDYALFDEDDNKNSNNKKDSIPGPGAYSPYDYIDSKKYLPLPEKHQNFGSSLSRSTAVNTATEDNNSNTSLVPGRYFLNAQSQIKRPVSKLINGYCSISQGNIDNTKFKKITLEREKSNHLIGPGSYDVNKSSFANDKGVSQIESFGSLEKRFIADSLSEKNNTPGAGSYLNLESWINPSKIRKYKPNPTEIRVVDKGTMPGVGEYHPEVFHSIEFNVQNKKCSKLQIAPFESNCRRFQNRHQLNINLGPGTYDVENNYNSINRKANCPLYRIDKKKETTNNTYTNIKPSKMSKIGPGAYDINSYFDWNKKSFNILFS